MAYSQNYEIMKETMKPPLRENAEKYRPEKFRIQTHLRSAFNFIMVTLLLILNTQPFQAFTVEF